MPAIPATEASGWPDADKTIDGNTTTYAEATLPPDTETDWLEITYPPTEASLLQFMATVDPDGIQWLDLQIRYEGGWHRLRRAHFMRPDKHWICMRFDAQEVTGVRFQFINDHIADSWVRVWEVELGACCGGPLADFCEFVHDIGDFWIGLGDDISDWAVVGDFLSQPFDAVGRLFIQLGDTCCEFSEWLQGVLDALASGITWDALLALIQERAPDLYGLMTDPVGWFLVKLTLAFDLEPYHTQSVEFLAKWVLEEYFPALYQLWLDPTAWIEANIKPLIPEPPDWLDDPIAWFADVLEEHFPLLYYLVVDPAGELLYLIAQLFDLTPYEAQSGEFVVKALFERHFPELYDLWRELSELLGIYERRGWSGLLEELKGRFYSLAERVLRFVWEGVWQE